MKRKVMTIQHNKLDIQKKNVSRLYQTQFLKAGWWTFCLQFLRPVWIFCSWFWCYGFDRQRKSHRFDAFFESRIRNHWKTEKAECGKNERSRNPTSQNRGRRKVNIYTWFFLLPLFFVWCKLFIFRVLLYQAVEDLLFKFGYEGKACLLRAICEMHESPLIGYGFFGEVLELFLTWVKPQKHNTTY